MSTPAVLPVLVPRSLKGFAPQLITDGAGLEKVSRFIERIRTAPLLPWDRTPPVGLDTETNITVDFFNRRLRTIQLGDASEQFCIDLLAFADGNEDKLVNSQGNYGKNAAIFDPVLKVVRPVIETNQLFKIGQNLAFEYNVLRWNLGLRLWSLYSIDMAERVILAGTHSLKDYAYYSLASIIARYFKKMIDKSLQQSFDLKTPLTQEQVDYGCLDIYLPLAVRQQQIKTLQRDNLVATVQIENDAVGSYTDMHLHGQRMDRDKWIARVEGRKLDLIDTIKAIDTYFIPVVGHKDEAIDETRLNQLETRWKELDTATAEELTACSAFKAVSTKKEPERRAHLKTHYESLVQNRKDLKAAARATYMELSKKRTEAKKIIAKSQGQALINYNSPQQVLAAFKKMKDYKRIPAVDKDTLLKFNNLPLIPLMLSLSKLKKEIGTYGVQWAHTWVTHPCKEEGWLHPGDGRLHCEFNQLDAETGRSSSSKPNAQNLPHEDDIRSCFICDPPNEDIRISTCCDSESTKVADGTHVCDQCGRLCETVAEEYCIVTVDMSGAELRIIAELAQAISWISAFAKGQDVHSVGTEILYPDLWPKLTIKSLLHPDGWTLEDCETERVPLFNNDGTAVIDKRSGKQKTVPPCAYFAIADKEITLPNGQVIEQGAYRRQKCDCPEHKKLRDGNKATNFLLAYGGGPAALAEALGITPDEAKELMKLHESKFPDIWGYLKRSGEQARYSREARDMFGRRRSFPEPTWEGAKEFFIQEHEDDLELSEEEAEANVLRFKQRELREPTEEEEYRLTHSDPTTKQISGMFKGMFASIERRGKNMAIQGTNASLAKRVMGCGFDKNGKGYLWHLLPKFKALLINFIHDEFVIQCPKRFGEKVLACVQDAILRAGNEVMAKVQMLSDGRVSDRWQK